MRQFNAKTETFLRPYKCVNLTLKGNYFFKHFEKIIWEKKTSIQKCLIDIYLKNILYFKHTNWSRDEKRLVALLLLGITSEKQQQIDWNNVLIYIISI